jgi:hypothetical protein
MLLIAIKLLGGGASSPPSVNSWTNNLPEIRSTAGNPKRRDDQPA